MEKHDRTSTSNRRPFRFGNPSHRVTLQRFIRDMCRLTCGASRGWLVALVLLPLVNGGCLTSALWEERNPNKRVWIPASRMTEEELRQKGREYETIRMSKQGLQEMGIVSQEDEVDGYLAEKSGLQKFGDYVVLTAATPVTVVIDGTAVLVVWLGLNILEHLPELLQSEQ